MPSTLVYPPPFIYMPQVCKDTSKNNCGKTAKGRLTQDSATAMRATDAVDYGKKILHMSWHPQDDIIAVVGNDKLYIYSAMQGYGADKIKGQLNA